MDAYPKWLRPHLRDFFQLDKKNLLAVCLYGEAAGESYIGKFAVGCVIRNRVNAPGWWGDSYHRVVLSPWQFSCFNEGAPTLGMMRKPKGPAWQDCLKAADAILSGEPDVTHGATHYFANYIKPPEWSKRMTKTVVVGPHEFYSE